MRRRDCSCLTWKAELRKALLKVHFDQGLAELRGARPSHISQVVELGLPILVQPW